MQKNKTAVAIGKFDGLHLGHMKILSETNLAAQKYNLVPTVYVINISNLLTTKDEKVEIIKNFGINNVVFREFDDEFKNISPYDFFENVLLKKLNAGHIVVGEDFCFGKNRSGNADLLKKLCSDNNIGISIVKKVSVEGEILSSTLVRSVLSEGNVEKARKILGRYYSVTQKVVHGKKLGSKLGFPTINFSDTKKLMPKQGVYITSVLYNGKTIAAITNVGTNPTVDCDNKIKVETFILDFCGDLYGSTIKVEFIKHIRDEMKFASEQELKNRVLYDIECARKYFEKI